MTIDPDDEAPVKSVTIRKIPRYILYLIGLIEELLLKLIALYITIYVINAYLKITSLY